MAEMIERVARAIYEADEPWSEAFPWPQLSAGSQTSPDEYRRIARAAIEAMKLNDPVEGVPGGIAFEDAFFGNQTTVFHAMRDAWNATVDSALAPSPR